MDVVAIAQAPELLLAGCVPHVELDGSSVGMEDERVHLHAQGGCGKRAAGSTTHGRRLPRPQPRSPAAPTYILLLELARQVALHKRRLPGAAVAHQDELRRRQRERPRFPPAMLSSRPPLSPARQPTRRTPVVHARTLNWTCGSPWAAIAAILRERAATARAPHKGRGREERAGRRGRGVRRWGGGKGSWPKNPGRYPFTLLAASAPRPPEGNPHPRRRPRRARSSRPHRYLPKDSPRLSD